MAIETLGTPFAYFRGAEQKLCRYRSGAQRAIESNGRERPDHRGDRIKVGDLPVWIEERNEKKPGKTAGQGPKHDLNGDESWPTRAAVSVSQMPLASGTCGHDSGRGTGANDTTAI